MKHDDDVQDDSAAPDGARATAAVNTSRRRFTRAGLSASAALTLASRPALATYCSHSGSLSGNLSRAGAGVQSCSGLSSSFWKMNETQWSSTSCNPGKCNATTYQSNQCMDYNHCTWGELKAAKASMPLERFRDYKQWANWSSTTPLDSAPQPTVTPTTCGELLAGTGLALAEPSKTMMQVYWDPPGAGEPDTLLPEACTAFLNVDHFGREAFGYSADELKDFISAWSLGPGELKDALYMLNNRG